MKGMPVSVALVTLLIVTLGSALAQTSTPKIDPPPEEPMARMMTMMEKMQADMQQMQKQIDGMQGKGMSGMGPMHDRMGHMMMMMGDTRKMMEHHRAEMRAQCPAFKGSAPAPGK
jgi:hypothetical protein